VAKVRGNQGGLHRDRQFEDPRLQDLRRVVEGVAFHMEVVVVVIPRLAAEEMEEKDPLRREEEVLLLVIITVAADMVEEEEEVEDLLLLVGVYGEVGLLATNALKEIVVVILHMVKEEEGEIPLIQMILLAQIWKDSRMVAEAVR
jgi:hypothetical protein